MDHAKPQLVIRLKTAKCNLSPPPKKTYIYFWDRIFAALAVLLLLVGLVAYGIYLLLQAETPPESVNVVGSNPETHMVSEPETTPERQETREDAALERPLRKLPAENRRITEVVDNPIRPLPAAPGIGTPSPQPEGTDTDLSVQRPKQPEAAPILETDTDPYQVEQGLHPIRPLPAAPGIGTPSPQPEGTDTDLSAQRPKQPEAAPILETDTDPYQVEQGLHSLPAETGAEQTQKERKRSAPDIAIAKHSAPTTKIAGTVGEASTNIEKNKMLAVAPDHDIRKALFRLRGISLAAPSVSRFVLAKSVVNKKPVGDIEDIAPDARGIAAVYAFSDVVGMKDEVLYYHWFRNSKQVAKFRIGVWADRWRSHSSKIINNKMKGEWRVELRNEKREILASADFVY